MWQGPCCLCSVSHAQHCMHSTACRACSYLCISLRRRWCRCFSIRHDQPVALLCIVCSSCQGCQLLSKRLHATNKQQNTGCTMGCEQHACHENHACVGMGTMEAMKTTCIGMGTLMGTVEAMDQGTRNMGCTTGTTHCSLHQRVLLPEHCRQVLLVLSSAPTLACREGGTAHSRNSTDLTT